MMQDNRLLPMSQEALDRPLRDLAQPAPVVAAAPSSAQEPAHLREYLAISQVAGALGDALRTKCA